jgi:hypothetical protein
MTPRLIPTLILALAALPALEETYKWIDEKGQVNYSNTPPAHVAGKAQVIEDRVSVMGMDPGVRSWAERHFTQQAYADEQDWQRRQQSMAAQQSYYAQPTSSYGSDYGYSYPYYGSYFYPTYIRRPILARAIVNNASPRFPTHFRSEFASPNSYVSQHSAARGGSGMRSR